MTPVYKVDDDGNQTNEIVKYQVTIGGGVEQYTVWVNGNYVHFVVNGNRYRLNFETQTIDRLVVNDMPASTVDFSTSYTPTQLRDNLVQNVKTTILNQIVQAVVDSTLTQGGAITIAFDRPIGQYVDLFTDSSSLEGYVVAWNLDIESDQCAKFAQIYKNNLKEVDESAIVNGNVYQYLQGKIQSAFGNNSNILVVDSPSIEVKRIDQVDTFTYNVLMDVHILQNKDWMK